MTSAHPLEAWRAGILHFLADPGSSDDPSAYEYFEDGLLLVRDGHVEAIGPASALLPGLPPGTPVHDHRGKLLMPGFIDVHVHYVQTDVIASPGRQLLDWLNDYTFPAERQFADAVHARATAEFFLDELVRNGTTSALVFGSVHRVAADAFFEAADARNMRMVAGKALMDRNCPDFLQDTPESAYRDTAELIERWSGHGRQNVAITPRFAITSTEAQLEQIARLAREYPDAHIHTHVAENVNEVIWAREIFPWAQSYLDIYDRYGLLRERAVYAHCIQFDAADRKRMAASGASAAFCPTSNLFLGSGLFDLQAADDAGFRVGIATDVGGGTSFSMLRTLGEAYKVTQMRGNYLSPLRAFYLATRGSARTLGLEDRIGSLTPGHEADFVILDLASTPLLARRGALARSLDETLFVLMTMADDRAVHQTCILGRPMLPRA